MQHLYEQIVQAAAAEASVFILGESGTGKELVAHTIHVQSRRSQQNFVAVNCGAITETLFEREFFGHRKGAFTGAHRDSPGYLQAAHQGMLFLDEIGELSPIMQVKLLRVLENREYIPVGDMAPKALDVRIIAATNRDVKELQSSGIMRRDFFYRLHVFALTIPPLREHKEDIPLLVELFLEHFGGDRQTTRFPGQLLDRFMKYPWPGNIRELQNEVQRFLAGQPPQFLGGLEPEAGPEPAAGLPQASPQHYPRQLNEALDNFEKQVLLNALEQHEWHRGATADHLDIPSRTLHRKMKKYDLTRPYRKSSSQNS